MINFSTSMAFEFQMYVLPFIGCEKSWDFDGNNHRKTCLIHLQMKCKFTSVLV